MIVNKVLISNRVLCSLILLLCICKPINGAVFNNVSLSLKWRSRTQDTTTVTIRSDDYLKSYVGDFGEVVIQDQNIPKLVKLSVSNLPKVTRLALTNCGIKTIQPGSFQNIPALTDLDLSGNLLVEIEDGVFTGLNFKTLYLENNKIVTVGSHAFNNLKMEYLFMDHNRISEWKSEWFQGTPLEFISMADNLLQTLPRLAFEYLWHFAKDTILINLTLSNNKLINIDPDAFRGVKTIFTLNLQNNSLIYLEPGLFDTVESIDQIDLSHNRISTIYYEVFRRTKTSLINVYDNLVTCVSTDIFNGTQLQILNVGRNPVSCSCVQEWTTWRKMNQKPEISEWTLLKKSCESAATTTKSSVIFAFLFVYLTGIKQ